MKTSGVTAICQENQGGQVLANHQSFVVDDIYQANLWIVTLILEAFQIVIWFKASSCQ